MTIEKYARRHRSHLHQSDLGSKMVIVKYRDYRTALFALASVDATTVTVHADGWSMATKFDRSA